MGEEKGLCRASLATEQDRRDSAGLHSQVRVPVPFCIVAVDSLALIDAGNVRDPAGGERGGRAAAAAAALSTGESGAAP